MLFNLVNEIFFQKFQWNIDININGTELSRQGSTNDIAFFGSTAKDIDAIHRVSTKVQNQGLQG